MTPLPSLALLAWSSLGFAADAAEGTSRSVATPAEIAGVARELQTATGGPVLLAAAGADAERAAIEAAKTLPTGAVRVARVGIIGDDEVGRALDAAGLVCALRVDATPSGAWALTRHGRCEAAADVTAPAIEAPRARASVTAIPGVGAALGTGAPAAATPVQEPLPRPLAPPPPPPREALTATYDAVALLRVPNPKPRPELPEASWIVRDGRGRTLNGVDFARRTGDLATERRIGRDGAFAKGLGLGLAVGGGALLVSGLGVLAARDAGAPDWSDFEPDLSDFGSNSAYFEALGRAEADYRAAEDAHDILREDRVWIAGALTGAGVLALGAAPFASQGASDRRALPSLYWDADTADALIRAHNDAVKQRIGLEDPAPVRAVVVPPPEPDDPEDPPEDLLDDPVEDAAPPADGGAPQAPRPLPPADPAGPSGARDPYLTPVVGFAWAGLVGTF